MPNFENFLTYQHWQHAFVGHIFALTVAVFLAGLVYFILSMSQISPRYRLTAVISAVVMVSAALEIGQLFVLWQTAFSFVPVGAELEGATAVGPFGAWAPVETTMFSNGYRYVNWSIDVPMLLTQLLVVLGLTGAVFWQTWWKLTVAGLLMIWTGYVGQFYEPGVAGFIDNVSTAPFYIWFLVSCVFYGYLLWVLYFAFQKPVGHVSPKAQRALNICLWIILLSWLLYPIAYLVPAFWADSNGVVARQTLFTIADIVSKLVFGVVLSRAARIRSADEGWEPAALVAAGPAAPHDVSEPTPVRHGRR